MPAAIAVPAIVSAVGIGAQMFGQHKQMSAQQKADAAKRADVNKVLDYNFNANTAYQDKNAGAFANMLAAAGQPQTTTQSNWSDSTQSMDFGAGNADRDKVRLAAENAPWEVNNLLAQQKALLNSNISGQQRAQDTAINNAAAARGVRDPSLMKLGANQGINSARLKAGLDINQQGLDNKRQAYGDITGMLKNLYQTNRNKSRGGAVTTGPADLNAQLNIMNAQRPVQKEYANV
jgi:hypothetical protein